MHLPDSRNSVKKSKIVFFFLGISTLAWFLIRVIPKPSRATYPCMRASAPIMSAFIIYIIGLASTVYIFKKQNRSLLYSRFTLASLFVAIALFSFSSSKDETQLQLVDASYFQANAPIGTAKGIFPGRVVWVYNPDVTNEYMTNTASDYWAMDLNCDQELVDSMMSSGIRRIGGKADVKQAWDNVFKYFNNNHGKGYKGYTPGEKFAIKINLTNSSCNCAGPDRMDASPQITLAILHQLIEVVGVPQADIWIGDNYRTFRDEYFSKCHDVYPNVHYVDGIGGNGREQTVPSAAQLLKFSDKKFTASIPQHYVNATYFINMPCLKTHNEGGITLAAKNHQGSILKSGDPPAAQSAYYMHYSLPKNLTGTKKYRHTVDYMGHKDLGGKTLIYIVDGLWAGKSWEGWLEKWQMAPFNDDYPSSIFMSQDAVAIESVGFDFLLEEYSSKPISEQYPYISGADDYLLQAADPANWPVSPAVIKYDPEGDGTILNSLGVYEHWNNATDKQYSRNLGTGEGIELKTYFALSTDNYTDELTSGLTVKDEVSVYRIYPNPFSRFITIEVSGKNDLDMNIYDLQGKTVFSKVINGSYTWNAIKSNGSVLEKGNYVVKLSEKSSGKIVRTEKIIFN
jgi:hypothetical protein